VAEPDAARATRIGFIGLGIMGRPMARNLIAAGHPLAVHSRSPAPVDELVAIGARRCGTPAEVARASDVVITMLPDTPDVETVTGGPDGLLEAAPAGCLVIDMSTIDPIATRRIGAGYAERGVAFVDAPVSGGEQGAIDGALSIMVGGADPDVERARPIFEVLGRTVTHVGAVGAGQVAKAANQLVVGLTIQAVAEALALAEAAGVDPSRVRDALMGGFAASRVLEVHGRRMIDRDFRPGFRLRLHLKDARIIAHTAAELGVRSPAFDVVLGRLGRLADAGRGDLDHSALFLAAAAEDGEDAEDGHPAG
jgi:2-hydroxy-3-oxopropionate reductase